MGWLRVVAAIAVVVVSMGLQCNQKQAPEQKTPVQQAPAQQPAVYGVVRGSPPKGMPPTPPAELGSTVPGAIVALRQFTAKDTVAGAEVVSTTTDSTGAYRLVAPPGTYFLTVAKAQIPYARYTTGYFDKNFAPADSVNAYRVIELSADREENLTLPQGWPE